MAACHSRACPIPACSESASLKSVILKDSQGIEGCLIAPHCQEHNVTTAHSSGQRAGGGHPARYQLRMMPDLGTKRVSKCTHDEVLEE